MTWLQRLFRRTQMEDQLNKELRFHIDQHAADLLARGYPAAEAQRQAVLAFGGTEQIKEDCRDVTWQLLARRPGAGFPLCSPHSAPASRF